jgi:hypothetical protein
LSIRKRHLHGNIMADQKTSYCLINKLLEWGFGSNFQRNFGLGV